MNIDFEITGKIAKRNDRELEVRIYFDGVLADNFELDLINKVVTVYPTHKAFRGGETHYTEFENLTLLMKSLGLDVPESYVKHWTPKIGEGYFYVDSSGEICPYSIHKTGYHKTDIKRYENYNAFPTRDLAEKGKNLSKLGRLILLWQFVNNCLFTPDWRDSEQCKYYIMYNYKYSEMRINIDFSARQDKPYFQTREQAKAFVEMYKKEIKDTMEI